MNLKLAVEAGANISRSVWLSSIGWSGRSMDDLRLRSLTAATATLGFVRAAGDTGQSDCMLCYTRLRRDCTKD